MESFNFHIKGTPGKSENSHKPGSAALSLSTKRLKKEKKGEGEGGGEWQRVIRGAGEAKRGETDRQEEK